MIMVYVAGPYSAPTPEGVEDNCRRAREIGVQLAAVDPCVFPVIPHQVGRDIEHIGNYEYWIDGTLELMRRCDAVFMVPGWELSKGADAELKEATRLDIPSFDSLLMFSYAVSQETITCCAPERRPA